MLSSLVPESSRSLRLTWRIIQPHKYIEGFLIKYKEARRRQNFLFVKVHHSRATSYSITRLEVNTIYEVFIVPFYKTVMGMPSRSQTASTKEEIPKKGPEIESVIVSGEDVNIGWFALNQDETGGILQGFRLLIISEPEKKELANIVVSPTDFNYKVNLPHLSQGAFKSITIKLAAINKAGTGPFSKPLTLSIDDLLSSEDSVINMNSSLATDSDSTNVWVGAFAGSTFLFVICITIVLLLRKQKSDKETGYLPHSSNLPEQHEKGETLWIDRRWNNTDSQDEYGKRDKKLLHNLEREQQTENEYAYIASFASDFAINRPNCHMENVDDPTPYASTDILRNQLVHEKTSIYKVSLIFF